MTSTNAIAALPIPRRGSGPLSRKAKAAIIVQFILNDGADVPLSALPEEHQVELTQLLGSMRYIDRETLNSVLKEFADTLESIGLSFPGDMAGALNALDGKISDRTAARLRKEAGVRQTGDPWQRINALTPEKLQEIVLSEGTEIAVVLLSKIDVAKAAKVLSGLPGDRARRITYAMSMTSGITPDAVERIGISLAGQMDAEPARAFKAKPDERVGAILNYTQASTRDDLLSGLDESDKVFADAVRKAIFTFANIPERLAPLDVPKITRDVPIEVLATAIAGATSDGDKAAVEFILENMSKRMAGSLREEAEGKSHVKAKQAEEAMTAIVGAIRDLVTSGEITLVVREEER